VTADIRKLTVDDLWHDVPAAQERFDPASVSQLPEPVRRYLTHAIAPDTPLASAVRLEMVGTMRLTEKWLPFKATQVVRRDRGFIWKAAAKMAPLVTVSGSDRFIEGQGAMRWKLFGLIPVVTGSGPDISRSASARFHIESMWLPSMLLDDSVEWHQSTSAEEPEESESESRTRIRATISSMGYESEVSFTIDARGRVVEAAMSRWGNPDGGEHREVPFGGIVGKESTFDGYTIPADLRVGWHFGTDRFEPEGEFWRARITSAAYR
jgi:hypothetical protein